MALLCPLIPRTRRVIQAGFVYHVLNRGNGRMSLFRKDGDFLAFERILAEGLTRYPVDLLTYCLMGNHWHLVVQPRTDDALGQWMGWVGVTHVRRHHAHHGTGGTGHLYQGRFKSFPVQDDAHSLTLCRYVEANPLRAGMVTHADAWPWSGLHGIRNGCPRIPMSEWPVERPADWLDEVNEAIAYQELARLRTSVNRGSPWGDEAWVHRTAKQLGLTSTLRDPGRPTVS